MFYFAELIRSYLGYPPVRIAEPNPTHYAVAALQKMGFVSNLITQVSLLLHLPWLDYSALII